MYKFPILILILTGLLFACSDDDDMQEEEMEESVDITTMLIGSYTGLSTFTEGGSSFTEEDRTAAITTVSDSTTNISIGSIGGAFNLRAQMNSELEFTVEDATIFEESPYSGSGNLNGNTLTIELVNGDKEFTYVGTK